VTVAEAVVDHAWVRHVQGVVTIQVMVEVAELFDLLSEVYLSPQPDTFIWTLTADNNYSVASAYGAMFLGSSSPVGAKQLWKTAAPPRVRFFYWLVMHGRCWTVDRRYRHGLQPDDRCIFCDQCSETMEHILLGYTYSREVWHRWISKLHLLQEIALEEEPVMSWWLRSRKRLPKSLRKGFDSFLFLVGWIIWKERKPGLSTPLRRQQGVL
jgi:hypothetical protein